MKYRFEVSYQNKACKDISIFMKKCDLDFEGIWLKEVFEFTSKFERPIPIWKQLIEQAFFHAGLDIGMIEGGLIDLDKR